MFTGARIYPYTSLRMTVAEGEVAGHEDVTATWVATDEGGDESEDEDEIVTEAAND